MRIESFPAVLALAATAVWGVSCASPRMQPDQAPVIRFPLAETARIPCQGPLLPGIAAGPGGRMVVASSGGLLQALNPESQAADWTFTAGASTVAPIADGARIFWAVNDGRVFCLDAEGKEIWTQALAHPVQGEMRLAGDRLVFREGDKALSALNAVDGSAAWSDPASLPADWTSGEERIVSRTAEGRLRVLDFDGRLITEFSVGESAAGALGLSGGLVLLGYADGRLAAYDLRKGKRRWTIRLGGVPVGSPVSDGRTIFVVLSNHIQAALRARRGNLIWWRPLSGRAAFPPRLSEGDVFVTSRSHVFQTFLKLDGTEQTAFQTEEEILAPVELIGPKAVLSTVSEAGGEALVIVLDLFPKKPAEKTSEPITRVKKRKHP